MFYSLSDYKRASRAMGKVPINPLGSCFDSTLHQFIAWAAEGVLGLKLCHAICIANMPGQRGRRIAHAWIEFVSGDEVYAYDAVWGVKQPAFVYRRGMKIEYIVEYNLPELRRIGTQTNSPAPWDPVILKLMKELERKK